MNRQPIRFRKTPVAWALLSLSTSVVMAQTSAANSTSDAASQQANEQVLRSWQQQTGQAASVSPQGQIEFHGGITVDAYSNKVSSPSGNPALTPLRENDFGKLVFQGDVRTQSPEQDVTYLQGVLTATNDRSLIARYANQINSFQTGRAGVGYQFAFGDVVANFSGLSSNLGLRGALAAKQWGGLTVTGVAGTVAESWEALFKRDALDNLPPRTRYLRDVLAVKAEYAFSPEFSAFATLQNYADRQGSAALPVGTPALDGTVVSTGLKYTQGGLQLTSELAVADTEDKLTGAGRNGNAFVFDGSYRFASSGVGLRFGFHDLDAKFASLAQTVAPGIQEWYIGADWPITPQLNWSIDLRDATTRVAATAFAPASSNDLETINNRLSYSFTGITGLMLSLSDTRNKARDALGNASKNDTTQISLNYGAGAWSASLGIGQGHSRSKANPAGDVDNQQWQLNLGRSWNDASNEKQASWNLGLQGFAGEQTQKLLATATQSQSTQFGLNLTASSTWLGQLLLGLQRQNTLQPTPGAPRLATTTVNLDWTKSFTPQWQLKGYAKINRRNHGDLALQVDERIIGVQGSYKW